MAQWYKKFMQAIKHALFIRTVDKDGNTTPLTELGQLFLVSKLSDI